MSLCYEVASAQSVKGSCIGNFFAPEIAYLAIPDGQNIVFRRIEQGENVYSPVRQRIVANGIIISLTKIPYMTQSPWLTSNESALEVDLLLIHSLSYTKEEGHVDTLTFKQFDGVSQEFSDLGCFSIKRVASEASVDHESFISICNIPGKFYGTVMYSSTFQAVNLIDPLNPKNRIEINLKNSTAANGYFVNESTLVLVQENIQVGRAIFVELKATKNRRINRFDISSKLLGDLNLPASQKVLHVGQIISKKNYALIFYRKMATLVDFGGKKVTEKKSYGLDLPRETNAVYPLETNSEMSVFITTLRDVYQFTAKDLEMVQIPTGILSHDVSINEISPNFYEYSMKRLSDEKIVTYSLNGFVLDEIVYNGSDFHIFSNLKWMYHEFSMSQRMDMWAQNSDTSGHTNIIKVNCGSKAYLENLNLNLPSKVKSIWVVNEDVDHPQFLISTESKTQLIELGSDCRFISIPGIDIEVPTVAASDTIQVTPTKVCNYKTGEGMIIPFTDVLSAAIIKNVTVVMSKSAFLVAFNSNLQSEKELISLENDIIISLSCSNEKIAILTPTSILCYNIEDNAVLFAEKIELPVMGYSISVRKNDIFVGLSNGNVFAWPSQKIIPVSCDSVRQVRVQSNGVLTCVGMAPGEISIYDSTLSLLYHTAIKGCQDIVQTGEYSVALIDGKLKLLSWSSSPTQTYEELTYPSIKSFQTNKVIDGISYWIDSTERIVYSATPLEGKSSEVSAKEFPQLSSQDYQSEFYFPEMHPELIIEIARYQKPSNSGSAGGSNCESEDEDEDEDDFWNDENDDDSDFNVNFVVRLYKISSLNGCVNWLETLSENETYVEGDPYEAVIVKFYAPLKFTIFSYYSECVTCQIEQNDGVYRINFGSPTYISDPVYDDQWIWSNSSDFVTIVDSSGFIYSVPTADFNKCPYPTPKDSKVQLFAETNVVLNEVKKIKQISSSKSRYAALLGSRNSGEVVLFDYDGKDLVTYGRIICPSHGQLISFNPAASEFYRKFEAFFQNSYGVLLTPEVLFGTPTGAVYALSPIEDKELYKSLYAVQDDILNQLGISMASEHFGSNKDSINANILLDALNIGIFAPFINRNIDPQDLKSFFLQILS